MPTSTELDQLQGILARLTQLGATRPGEPIRSAEWNQLVQAVTEVARAVLARGETPREVAVHAHDGEVALSWLTPELRRRIENTGPKPAPTPIRPDILDKLRDVEIHLNRFETLATRLEATDVKRSGELVRVQTRLDGITDERQDVLRLREAVDGVRERYAAIATNWIDEQQQPIDLKAAVAKIGRLEQIEQRLRRGDGTLVDAAAFESELARLRADLVTEEDLRSALDARATGVSEQVIGNITRAVNEDVAATLANDFAALRQSIREQTSTELAAVDARLQSRLAAEREGLVAAARSGVEVRIDTAVTALGDRLRGEVRTQIEGVEAQFRTRVDERVAGIRAELPQLVGASLAERLPGVVANFEAAVGSLQQRLDRESARIDEVRATSAENQRAIGNGLAAENSRRENLRSELLAQLASQLTARDNQLATRFATLESRDSEIQGQLTRNVTDLRREAEAASTRFDVRFSGLTQEISTIQNRVNTLRTQPQGGTTIGSGGTGGPLRRP